MRGLFICAALALLLCLGTQPYAAAQQPDRADLERRLAVLEKQLGALLNEVKGLRTDMQAAAAQAATPAPPKMELKIFALRNADAADMMRVLTELFQGRDGRTQMHMRITADPRTNSVLVHTRTDLLEAIEAVVARLEETRAPGKGAAPVKKAEQPSGRQRAILEKEVALAEAQVAAQKDRAAWSQRMAKLGFMTGSQVQVEEMQLHQAEFTFLKAKAKLDELPVDAPDPKKELNPSKP